MVIIKELHRSWIAVQEKRQFIRYSHEAWCITVGSILSRLVHPV